MKVKLDLLPYIQKKEIQLGHSLSNREISLGSQVHETTISNYRKGVSMVKLETLGKLAEYLGCDPGDFIKTR